MNHEPANRSYQVSYSFIGSSYQVNFLLPTITPGPVVANWLDNIRRELEELTKVCVWMGIRADLDPAKHMLNDLRKELGEKINITEVTCPNITKKSAAQPNPFFVGVNPFAKTSSEA